MTASMHGNEAILAGVDALGGGSVWEDDIFAVTLVDVVVSDSEVRPLCNLVGVKQIAVNASALSFETLECVARIPQLESLVLNNATLTSQQRRALEELVPEVILISE